MTTATELCIGQNDAHTISGVMCNVCGARVKGDESPHRFDERRTARYTDDEPVKRGDLIRYRQTPGGILPASPEWTYGVAEPFPHTERELADIHAFNKAQGYIALNPDELYLTFEKALPSGETRTTRLYIVGHIVERAS